jgi:hypothetical protein
MCFFSPNTDALTPLRSHATPDRAPDHLSDGTPAALRDDLIDLLGTTDGWNMPASCDRASAMQKRFRAISLPTGSAFKNRADYGLISGTCISCTSIARPSRQSS